MSKQFAAAAIALLVEQGKLRLDQDIRSIVPELPDYGRKITIANLVHHTSGLRDYLGLWGLAGRSMTDSMPEDQILELIARQKALNFLPGTEYAYSNTGYQLISLIVHRVSGEPLSLFAEKNIFGPLGMSHTHFHDDVTRLVPFNAAPYQRRADGSFALVRTQVALVGAGKAYSTVGDLALWDGNFYENRLGKGGPELIRQLLSISPLSDGKPNTYAFGLAVETYRGLDVVRHSDGSVGISTMMMRFPRQKLSVIVLGNVAQFRATAMAEKIADIYLADVFTAPAEKDEDEAVASPAPALALTGVQRAALVGRYHSDELDTDYVFSAKGEKIEMRAGNSLRATLIPFEGDRFSLVDDGDELATGRFMRNGGKAITGFQLDAGRVRGIVFSRKPG